MRTDPGYYWDLPAVSEESHARADALGIDLHSYVSGADEPHDVRRILDQMEDDTY